MLAEASLTQGWLLVLFICSWSSHENFNKNKIYYHKYIIFNLFENNCVAGLNMQRTVT